MIFSFFSDNLKENGKHACAVFKRLKENQLYIKLEKYEFGQIKAVVDWSAPRYIKEKQLVGFANF